MIVYTICAGIILGFVVGFIIGDYCGRKEMRLNINKSIELAHKVALEFPDADRLEMFEVMLKEM